MATLPSADTTISETAGAPGGGLDTICIWAPCATSADVVPRLFGSAAAAYAQHGYCDGVEYAARHCQVTGKSFIFVGLPIATAGVVGRVDKTGNTGSSVASVTAGGSGVLGEHDGVVKVKRGGTVGTSQIVLELSLDGGRKFKDVRIGTGNSYVIPFVGVTLSLAAGTLVAGDTIITWSGTSPRSDSAGWVAARDALAKQLKFFRSVILAGDVQSHTEANALLDEINSYQSANDRFTYARASIADRLPQAALSHDIVRMTGSPTLTFAEVGGTGDTITRSVGSWITDGFQVGDTITVAGSVSNNVTGPIASLSATVITFGTTDLAAEGPVSNCTVTGTPTLTFAEVGATGDTITRNRGSWTADGFRVGDTVTVAGTASNNVSGAIASLSATVLTFGTTDLAAEVIGASSGVTVTAGQTKAAWMAAAEAEYETTSGFRLDLSAGRARFTSPFSNWYFRRPAAWFASVREYQHDLHIPTWRKADGSVGGDLWDEDGDLVEWDDRVDGGAGSAARFTTLRTWSNDRGSFVALSLTRGDDGALTGETHNVAVVNEACRIIQFVTENFVGRTPVLNDDGTAADFELSRFADEANRELELGLLQDSKNEGPRASKAIWTPSASDVLNVADATVNGVLDLNLNGTIHHVNTVVRIRSGGQ